MAKPIPPLRALPRVFVPDADASAPIDLPEDEVQKLRKVLRLSVGDWIAVLPNNGTLIRCSFQNKTAEPDEVFHLDSEPDCHLTLVQALPKNDKIDTIIRAGTEIGISSFVLFSSDRTVVKWDEKKTEAKLRRLETIAREAAEVSFRTKMPTVSLAKDLAEVLQTYPDATVLSEVEGVTPKLTRRGDKMTIVVGPEGGWSPREVEQIGDRGVTLGPRVLRVDTAGPAAAAILLLS